jgi:polyhydroxyalkanoate synthase
MGCWLSSPFALRCAKNGSLPLSSPSANPRLEKALAIEAKIRATEFLAGLLRYVETPYSRDTREAACIWKKGNARLLDYGQGTQATADQPIVLFVPSLINRYYILDLEEERSMLRHLATQGIYPLVLDWGAPGEMEKNFGCGDYITEILNAAIEFIAHASRQRIILAGYCMGGVLAMAAAKLQRKNISALALFATPWDFYCKEFAPFVLDEQWQPAIEATIAKQQHLPAEMIQSLFYLTDPWIFEQKFRRFAELQPDSRAARDFIALEHWVNDGVPMTAQVARDCLFEWAQKNTLMKNQWHVAGQAITPKALRLPTFIAIPKNDHVVPLDCALPLVKAMPHAHLVNPGAGHVGMIVGSRAKRELWQPFAEWARAVKN